MNKINENELIKILQTQFLEDPEDHLGRLSEISLSMRTAPDEALREMLRELHSLKGSSQVVGFSGLGDLLHAFEAELQALNLRDVQPQIDMGVTLVVSCVVEIEAYFSALRAASSAADPYQDKWRPKIAALTQWLKTLADKPFQVETLVSKAAEVTQADNWGMEERCATASKDASWGLFDETSDQKTAAAANPAPTILASPATTTEGWGLFGDVPPTVGGGSQPTPNLEVSAPPRGLETSPKEQRQMAGQYLIFAKDQQRFALSVAIEIGKKFLWPGDFAKKRVETGFLSDLVS